MVPEGAASGCSRTNSEHLPDQFIPGPILRRPDWSGRCPELVQVRPSTLRIGLRPGFFRVWEMLTWFGEDAELVWAVPLVRLRDGQGTPRIR